MNKLDPRNIYDDLHQIPELGFEEFKTSAYLADKLEAMGYKVTRNIGGTGVIGEIKGSEPGPVMMLRADMDALPIPEDSGEEFSSEVPGKMHGCGHDMHTAMLLGAAKLLKAHEDELEGTVKLEFQPAEEIFQGSPDMIAGGLLEDPHVDAAVMFHVLAGMPLPVGTVLVPGGGIPLHRRGILRRLLPLHGGGQAPRRECDGLYDRAAGEGRYGHDRPHRRQARRRQRGFRLREP